MNVPVELIVFLGGGNLAMLSLCAHILVSILEKVSRQATEIAVIRARFNINSPTLD